MLEHYPVGAFPLVAKQRGGKEGGEFMRIEKGESV
jgi:hypothetical protein